MGVVEVAQSPKLITHGGRTHAFVVELKGHVLALQGVVGAPHAGVAAITQRPQQLIRGQTQAGAQGQVSIGGERRRGGGRRGGRGGSQAPVEAVEHSGHVRQAVSGVELHHFAHQLVEPGRQAGHEAAGQLGGRQVAA